MPRHYGPRLVVDIPAGRVWEPLRPDLAEQVARFVQVLAWVPASDQVWHVEVES